MSRCCCCCCLRARALTRSAHSLALLCCAALSSFAVEQRPWQVQQKQQAERPQTALATAALEQHERTRCLTTTATATATATSRNRNRNISALQNNANPERECFALLCSALCIAFCQRNQARVWSFVVWSVQHKLQVANEPDQVQLPQTERRLCVPRAKCVRPVCGLRKAESR